MAKDENGEKSFFLFGTQNTLVGRSIKSRPLGITKLMCNKSAFAFRRSSLVDRDGVDRDHVRK